MNSSYAARLSTISSIGTPENVASCINAWVKSWMVQHHPQVNLHLTSTLPRVHLDNVLRRKVDDGSLSEHNFTLLMDHSLATSDEHYCSFASTS